VPATVRRSSEKRRTERADSVDVKALLARMLASHAAAPNWTRSTLDRPEHLQTVGARIGEGATIDSRSWY